MGGFARYPIALAPGMGLNAYFTYVVVKGMGISWQVALGAVFLSGALFVALTLAGVIKQVVAAIPTELYSAIAAGIGLLLALVGFRNSGIIVPNASTTVAMGNLREPNTLLAIFGLLLIAALLAWRVKGAMLIGILATTALGVAVRPGALEAADVPLLGHLGDRPAAGSARGAGARLLRDRLRLLLHRRVRQRGHAGGGRQEGRPFRRGQPDPAGQPHPAFGRLGDHGGRRWRAPRPW